MFLDYAFFYASRYNWTDNFRVNDLPSEVCTQTVVVPTVYHFPSSVSSFFVITLRNGISKSEQEKALMTSLIYGQRDGPLFAFFGGQIMNSEIIYLW